MNDRQIRKILIEYLKTNSKEIRIYQEKSIGSSICDLMAVTDRLSGYEIKSDRDNYQRLASQVNIYERVFDENYVVIGSSHRASIVQGRVPANWGIIVINETGVLVERKAAGATASHLQSKAQLSLLWKLELKNLLTKTNLPLFTYKAKDYIIDQIVQRLDDATIHQHVVYELLHRDYSAYQAKDHSIASFCADDAPGGAQIDLPAAELVDMLSENNLEQFTLDQWIALYRQAKEVQEAKQTVYHKNAVQRTPHDISYREIEVSLGVPWVSKKIISDFVYFLRTGQECTPAQDNYVHYEPITGYWFIADKKMHLRTNEKERIDFTYGLPYYNAFFILEATLNLREIKLYDARKQYDEQKTVAALEKQEEIRTLFQAWVWQDEDRRWEIEETYNKLFGRYKAKSYDGSALQFPDMSREISLYPYQKDAVQRIIAEKNTLLAFDVGAGKTYIMIAAAMKMRAMGISRKNMFVVPNNIVGQWELLFKKMYPRAKLLSVEPKAFKPQMRQKVLAQIRDGDYDGIIIAYSCFALIPLSGQAIIDGLNTKLAEINTAVARLGYTAGTKAALEREATYLKGLAAELLASLHLSAGEISFDQLEINGLFVDEAHNFKNLPLRTNLKNIAGINTKGSHKCLEMLHKVRAIQEANHGRGVVFATGTPLCNSLADAYAMQLYLQYEELKDSHLDQFDNWIKTFAKPERVCEIDVDTSKFRFVNRLSRFFNLPELARMFSDIAVFHAMDGDSELPTLDGYDDILIPNNVNLQSYMNELCQRSERIRAKAVDRSRDNMLKVSTDGRKAALDLRLVGQKQPYDESSKIFQCVNKVMSIYRQFSGCAQIVFCDHSTPKGDRFNVYAELRRYFIEQGVPAPEIAFIHSYHTEARKVELYEKVNQGQVRILIGSTFKLGVGANVQTKLKAVHHLDIPWRPADVVQREGRIIRKGNEHTTVQIYRYICKGSFDAYSWQILETKQRFISQFLSGSTYQRSASDLEENILTYAQVKAAAISDPRMKTLVEAENELRKIEILSAEFISAQNSRRKQIVKLQADICALEERISKTEENLLYVQSYTEQDFSAEYARIKLFLTRNFIFNTRGAKCSFLGFTVTAPEQQNEKQPFVLLSRLGIAYAVRVGSSPAGNARRVANFLKGFAKLGSTYKQQIEQMQASLTATEAAISCANPYTARIKEMQQGVEKLRAEITTHKQ